MGCGLRAALGSSGACLHRGADPSSGSALQPVHPLQCPLLSLWASSLQDHPPLYWPLRFVGWGEPCFWLNKDFLVDTLTWPVVFGEGLQRQLLGSPLSLVDPDVAHPPGARPQARSALLFSVTSSHILWALATKLGPHLGLGPHHSLTAPFPGILISVPCHVCPAPSQTLNSLVSLLAETKLFSVDARVSAALAPPLGGLQPSFLGYDRPQGSGSRACSLPLSPGLPLREEAESPSWGATGYLRVGHTYLYLPGGRTVAHPHKGSFVVGMEKLWGVGFPLNRGHPDREDRPTLRLLTATNLCFAERNVYTSEVLAVVMQQLMEQSPLPMLLMRTVIQSLTMYPRLGGFVMNILARLIMKQVTCPGPRPQ